MKLAIEAMVTIALIIATLVIPAYVMQLRIAQDCAQDGQFVAGDLVYRCEVARWAR